MPAPRPWSQEEDATLTEMHAGGATLKDVAWHLGRSESAVQQRYRAIGLSMAPGRSGLTIPSPPGVEERIALYAAQVERGEPITYIPFEGQANA
jgi:hypothetical protein